MQDRSRRVALPDRTADALLEKALLHVSGQSLSRDVCSIDNPPSASAPAKLRVFISYSRDDLAFADQLVEALDAYSFEPLIDRQGISGGEHWKERLSELIAQSDTVAFVLSPRSAASPICQWEVDEADRLAKRVIPVICGPLGDAAPPQRLRDLNYIYFYPEEKSPGSGFGAGLKRLVAALKLDLNWVRDQTRYGLLAASWEDGGKAENRLLLGSDVAAAKNWLERRPRTMPEPTEAVRNFIRASEEAEARRTSEERRRLAEIAEAQKEREQALQGLARASRRTLAVTVILLAAVAGGLAGWINQSYIMAQWRWWMVTRPYMLSQVRPYVLSAARERALKPGDTFKECAQACPEITVVPSGPFTMGSPTTEQAHRSREEPQHTVTFAEPFAVSKFEVTFADWDACVVAGGCKGYKPNDQGWGRGQQPVINVSWDDAQEYLAWLSLVTGKTYRLLSEAEYEFAARAGRKNGLPLGR